MKILIISNLYPNSLQKNKAIFNRSQFFELSSSCFIKVIAPVAWTDRLFLLCSTGQIIPHKEIIDGIEIYHPIYFFIPKIFSSFQGFFYFLSIYATTMRQIKAMRPDCIFATCAYPDSFAAVMLGRLYKVPVFIKVHGSDIHSIGWGFSRGLTVWTLKKAQKVFAVSKDLENKILQMGLDKKRLVTVYNGIDQSRFFPRNKTETRKEMSIPLKMKVLLYVGNLVEVKGPEILIDAFNMVRSETKSLILYVIGSGGLLKALQEKCRSYGIEKSVVFMGSVGHEKMNCWMNLPDLLVVPSRNEGVPNVILEAMACGVPVVCTRVGGIPEVIVENETGLLVEPDSPSELAGSIEQAFEKKWDRKAILAQAEKFSWKENASFVIDCITRENERYYKSTEK